jgi:hypothetical protein
MAERPRVFRTFAANARAVRIRGDHLYTGDNAVQENDGVRRLWVEADNNKSLIKLNLKIF